MTGARVLIVDDEAELRRALRRMLSGHGYATREAEDGASGLREFQSFKPDVVLLDLVLPDHDGVEVCRRLRESSTTPVIVLSAVGDERRKVEALDAGADDYLTKPFGSDELLARVRVALRHGSSERTQASHIQIESLEIDLERRRVTLAGAEIRLTPTEYSLLKFLAVNAGRVLTHPMLLRAVWGAEYVGDVQLLRTYINQLRSKLEDDANAPRYIRTEPGVGYRLVERIANPDVVRRPGYDSGVSNEELRDGVIEALAPLPVAARRLFGGYWLYLEDAFFGVISDGRLYFRTDDLSRAAYVERGMTALQPKHRPRGPKTVDRNFEVPAEVQADAATLCAWALRAAASER